MGTSSSYGGAGSRTPLVPTWLDSDGTEGQPPTSAAPPDIGGLGGVTPRPPIIPHPEPPTPPPTDRFKGARTTFSRFARSGGSDRKNLGRAIARYVSTASGGAKNAARRMGSSRAISGRLIEFLADVRERGADEALRAIHLESLVGRPIEEIFLGLMEYICPDGGDVDAGIGRDAFIETVAEVAALGIIDLDTLTAEQLQTVFEIHATHAIEARIFNDIGTRGVSLPTDVQAVERAQAQLRDFIRRGVADALSDTGDALRSLTREQASDFVGRVYESAFEVLRAMGESEASR